MYFLYNISIYIAQFIVSISALFDKKLRLFVQGRKTIFQDLSKQISKTDRVIWFHCASLGEFEQGRSIIGMVKKNYPNHKIVLTFFSPSGYEVQKNYNGAAIVTYLPLDSKSNAKKFITLVHPEIAVFVKYEFWPNILKELQLQNIPTIVVSAIFRKEQAFFNFFLKWMRKPLQTFTHFFVQDVNSKNLLQTIGFDNVTVSGDTRFDRVTQIKGANNTLDFIETFVATKKILVAGSTWQEDEDALVDYINHTATSDEKFIIAPHNITSKGIERLKNSIQKKVILFSENSSENAVVYIIDTIGILSKLYAYADIAYIGGGYTKSGVHNVLEPAVFGIPLIIGPNYSKFKEVKDLVAEKAITITANKKEVQAALKHLFSDENERKQQGLKAQQYVISQQGATATIVNYIEKIIRK